jgi:hypothetical protein
MNGLHSEEKSYKNYCFQSNAFNKSCSNAANYDLCNIDLIENENIYKDKPDYYEVSKELEWGNGYAKNHDRVCYQYSLASSNDHLANCKISNDYCQPSDIIDPSLYSLNDSRSHLYYNDMDNEQLGANSYILAKEQSGCRFLQKKIDQSQSFGIFHLYPNAF